MSTDWWPSLPRLNPPLAGSTWRISRPRNAFDTKDTEEIIQIVKALAPAYGGINLEDISAPRCFEIEARLREELDIPVFHDDQHGTAIVAAAAVYNGLRIVDKKFEDIKLVAAGAGAASIACVELLISMGLRPGNIRMLDRNGVIHAGRKAGMNPWKEKFAVETTDRSIDDAISDADVFLGLSGPGVLNGELDDLIQDLRSADEAERLAEAGITDNAAAAV